MRLLSSLTWVLLGLQTFALALEPTGVPPQPEEGTASSSLAHTKDGLTARQGGKPIPAPPNFMGWLGSIGGTIGVVTFVLDDIKKIVDIIRRMGKKHRLPPSWVVTVQVGADVAGSLEGASGDFPQVCLWDVNGELLGYSDQKIYIQGTRLHRVPGGKGHSKFSHPRPEGMPYIFDGGMGGVGIRPAQGKEHLREHQATYVTLVKRHFDPICVASVHVDWPDNTNWSFDGSWARASNMSWYLAHRVDASGRQEECFWLDHRGTLDSRPDRKEEYLIRNLQGRLWYWGRFVRVGSFPKWWWAMDVIQSKGIPTGDDLTDGMRDNGVDQGRVPLGVKFFLPAFKSTNYRNGSYANLTTDDFVKNPAKINWFYKNMREGDNPVYPIIDPDADYTDPNAKLIHQPATPQDVPVDCLTDWYYDRQGHLTDPLEGDMCTFRQTSVIPAKPAKCRKNQKRGDPEVPLEKRLERTLIVDRSSKGGSAAKALCEDPHSVGGSYANTLERQFCRMTDKSLWPFCDETQGITRNCFDEDTEVLVEESRPLIRRDMHWDEIQDWHEGGRVYGRSLGATGEPYFHR